MIDCSSYSDFAKDVETRRSVSGYNARLNGVAYSRKSSMQKIVSTSVTEAECIAATECAKDMISRKELMESIRLRVRLPMIF